MAKKLKVAQTAQYFKWIFWNIWSRGVDCGVKRKKKECCVRVFTGRLPLASWSKLLQTEARGKITIETANSFRHMITQPLNTMRFNSLYFAVIEVKHISCEKQFMSSFSGKRAFVWKENSLFLGKSCSTSMRLKKQSEVSNFKQH